MKKIVAFILCVSGFFSATVSAQLDLTWSAPPTIEMQATFDDKVLMAFSYSIVNQSTTSDTGDLRVDVQISPTAGALNNSSTTRSFDVDSIPVCSIANDDCMVRTGRAEFFIPFSGFKVPDEEELIGNVLTPREWIGSDFHTRACVVDVNTGAELDCSSDIAIEVLPPQPGFYEEVGRGETDSPDLAFRAPVSVDPNGNPMIDFLRFGYQYFDGAGLSGTVPSPLIEFDLSTLLIMQDPLAGYFYYDITIPSVEAGVRLKVIGQSCARLASTSIVCGSQKTSFAFPARGSVVKQLVAPKGDSLDSITLDWDVFSDTVKWYRLRRCEDGAPIIDCTEINLDTAGVATSYVDTNVLPGVGYRYEIFACDDIHSSGCDSVTTFDSNIMFRNGVTDVGFIGIAPDQFEDDSDASQAVAITANTSVGLERSFDQQGDVDWLRFTLTDASDISINASNGVGSIIGIELLDASLNPISFPTPNLLEDQLAAGDYFIRLTDLTPNTGVYVPAPYIASLTAATVPLAALPDQYEIDNSAAESKPILASSLQKRTLHLPADPDWIQFTLSEVSDVSINTSNTSNATIGIELFDGTLSPITGPVNSVLQVAALNPGNYFFRLTDQTPSSIGFTPIEYEVQLIVQGIPPATVPDQFEDDNVAARAKQIVANAAAQDRTFHVDGDIDWLRFSLSEASDISIDTFNNANADIRIELYDASLGLIGNPSNSRLQELALDAGDYFIRVVDGRSGAFVALEYSIALSASPVVIDGIQPDKFENDDIPGRAQVINRATSQIRSFHTADNNEWIRIDLDKPQSIVIATRGTNLADTQIFLFDSELERLDYSANTPGVATSHARLVTDTLAAGQYYALINQIDGRDEGFAYLPIERYQLIVAVENDRKADTLTREQI